MDRKKRILLVDDEPDILEITAYRIKTFGDYDVDTADNGFDAAKKVIDTNYDLILLDIMMPGIDGLQVCVSLKETPKTASIPVIIVSALNNAKIILGTKKAGAIDYIVKPFNPEILKTKIEKYIGSAEILPHEEIVEAVPVEEDSTDHASPAQKRRLILRKIETTSSLPVIPETLLHLSQKIKDLGANLGRYISADLGFSTDILLVANSSFYSPKQPVISIQRGISLIGTKTLVENIKKLIEKKQFLETSARKHLHQGFLYSCLAKAYSAKFIAENEGYGNPDEIYSLVFFKSMGSFFLMNYFPEEYETIFDKREDYKLHPSEREKQIIGMSSLEISAQIASKWRLPSTVRSFVDSYISGTPKTEPIIKPYEISVLADFCAAVMGYSYCGNGIIPDLPSFFEHKYPSFFLYSKKLINFVKQQINTISKVYKYPQKSFIKTDCRIKKIFLIGARNHVNTYKLMLESLKFEIIHRDWDNLVDIDNLLYDYIIADSESVTEDNISKLFQRKHLSRGIILTNDSETLKGFLENRPAFGSIQKPVLYSKIIEKLNE